MAQRLSVQRFDSPDIQGDDSYVCIIRPTVKQMKSAMETLKPNGREELSEAEKNAINLDAALKILEENIVEWNWVDEMGEPLPLPRTDPSVMDGLTDMEVQFLAALIKPNEESEERKNVRTGSELSSGHPKLVQ